MLIKFYIGKTHTEDQHNRLIHGLVQGWTTNGPRGPGAIFVRPAWPPEENNIMDEYCVPLLQLWVQPATKLTTHFQPVAVKRLPTTGLVGLFGTSYLVSVS